jgi:prevent-host-death family protein
MTIHVNIGEAKTRLSELVAAALRGEDVVLDKSGAPQVRLIPIPAAVDAERARLSERRRAAFGMWSDAFEGFDTSITALKADRPAPDERARRKFGPAD